MTEQPRDELREAADRLDAARETTDDGEASDRLDSFADRLRDFADADRGPDHGQLARLEHSLRDAQDDLGADGSDLVDEALSHVRAFRETVEGV